MNTEVLLGPGDRLAVEPSREERRGEAFYDGEDWTLGTQRDFTFPAAVSIDLPQHVATSCMRICTPVGLAL